MYKTGKKMLLHSCCAPCSIAIISELKQQFELTVFFYNPNIYPKSEYLKRKKYVIQVCKEWQVPMIDMDYEHDKWQQAINGLENEIEGGQRCVICFKHRMFRTAEYASENNFQYFATSLTSGRNKKAEVINPIGMVLAKEFDLIFYEKDWKKDGRQEKGKKMVEERKIYRQNYCGCVYSLD